MNLFRSSLLLTFIGCKWESYAYVVPSPIFKVRIDQRSADILGSGPGSITGQTVAVLFAEKLKHGSNEGALSGKFRQSTRANLWEILASTIFDPVVDPSLLMAHAQLVSVLRICSPSLMLAAFAKTFYPSVALALAMSINDAGVFAVVSQDSSQYIQNILTTSGLVYSLLTGQTWYFMYQQQEAIYLALFEEVTMAKSLLEQIALVCQGRESLYMRVLACIDRYIREDLTRFNDIEPAELISARPIDDPLEEILYSTSVGEPSIVYETVRALRQARARRLGALQKKLPSIHMAVLWSLAGIVLFTFPLLGAGSQTIGGAEILNVQAWYLSFIVFGIGMTMGVVSELQRPGDGGAYNASGALNVMITGLEEELCVRMQGQSGLSAEPSVDPDGVLEARLQ